MKIYIESIIGTIFILQVIYLLARKLFQIKEKTSDIKLIFTILITAIIISMINILGLKTLGGLMRLITLYFLLCCYCKVIFNKPLIETIIVTLIIYLCYVGCETVIAVIISIIMKIFNYDSMEFLQNTIIINTVVSISVYLVLNSNIKRLVNLVNNNRLDDKNSYIVLFIIISTLTLLLLRLPLSKWSFNFEFIFTMLLLLGFCLIGIVILKQRADIQETTSMYQQLAEYSNIMNNVLEEYRVVTHEHKNQLLIIRSMLENKDKEINDYLDNLLDKREGIKYKWIGELNHLPLSGLKGLINYKVLEMESLKLNKVISISKEVSKIKLEKLSMVQKDNLYSIVGIYLDNAIQAAKDSKQKEVSLEIYKDKKDLVIIIANTYRGKIELEKIDNYGYTTKGKKHGVGLHIVKNIIQTDSVFSSKKYLVKNYFVQELHINLNIVNDIKRK